METGFWPAVFNEKSGATVIGVRDFLVAYNANLNTKSVRRANSVAFDVREQGRVQTEDGTPGENRCWMRMASRSGFPEC